MMQSSADYSTSEVAAERPNSRLDDLANHMREQRARICNATDAVQRMTEQLVGSAPNQTESGAKGSPVAPVGTLFELEQLSSNLYEELDALDSALRVLRETGVVA